MDNFNVRICGVGTCIYTVLITSQGFFVFNIERNGRVSLFHFLVLSIAFFFFVNKFIVRHTSHCKAKTKCKKKVLHYPKKEYYMCVESGKPDSRSLTSNRTHGTRKPARAAFQSVTKESKKLNQRPGYTGPGSSLAGKFPSFTFLSPTVRTLFNSLKLSRLSFDGINAKAGASMGFGPP